MISFYLKIVVPYDGSELSKEALRTAINMASFDKRIEIHVLHVMKAFTTLEMLEKNYEAAKYMQTERANAMLREVEESLYDIDNPLYFTLREGEAGKEIVKYSEEAVAKSVYQEDDPKRSRMTLRILKLRMTDFIDQLHEHSVCEEREVFPVIDLYFRRLMKPSITPSIWVMEKEHELADLFVKSFMEAVDALSERSSSEQNRQTAAHLVQACLILTEHFELEEELIFPLADEMLTDIDFFYS
jgi:hemerythrin-like domain-containing protein